MLLEKTALIIIGIGAIAAFVYLIWRFASRRHSLPCPVWLRWFVELDNPFTRINRASVIIGHLDLMPGMAVADIGCGPGRLTVPVARAVGEAGQTLAMDIQQGMINRVREKAQSVNIKNIRYFRAGLGDGKLGRNQFDRVLLVTVIGEIPDRESAINEVFGALKPGGVLSITELIFDPHFQSRRTVRRLAGTAGFREKAFFGNRFAYTINFEKPVDV